MQMPQVQTHCTLDGEALAININAGSLGLVAATLALVTLGHRQCPAFVNNRRRLLGSFWKEP